ncbi:MAG: hypothetical protein SCH98_01120 [Deferrisomatales bacterium]|nr:hypothetical protein [Deferrisomatales bacterium]
MAKGIEMVLTLPDDPMFFEGLILNFGQHWMQRPELLRNDEGGPSPDEPTPEEQDIKDRLRRGLDETLDGEPSKEE